MNESSVLAQALENTLAGAIEALVQAGPALLDDMSLFQRLSDLQTGLGSKTLEASAVPSSQLSLGEFLQLTSATQQILVTLVGRRNSGLNAEALSAMDEVLTRLKVNLA